MLPEAERKCSRRLNENAHGLDPRRQERDAEEAAVAEHLPQQARQRHGQDRGRAAGHRHQQRILPGISDRVPGSAQENEQRVKEYENERGIQDAMKEIRLKYGANAMLKGFNFLEGATARERNVLIGGHKA